MSYNKAALDRHITGNYGEDQFKEHRDSPDIVRGDELCNCEVFYGFESRGDVCEHCGKVID